MPGLALLFALSVVSMASFGSGAALAQIAPVVDPGERRTMLASLPYSERVRLCRGRLNAPVLDVTATISGPVRRQNSNAQHAGIALSETIEAWYAGRAGATSLIRDTLRKGAEIQAFTRGRACLQFFSSGLSQMSYRRDAVLRLTCGASESMMQCKLQVKLSMCWIPGYGAS